MQPILDILNGLDKGDTRALARAISLVENDLPGSYEILTRPAGGKPAWVAGITGPPGAGKSTLINALAGLLAAEQKVAILAVDPTSPFTNGSLLGDRLRMPGLFNNGNVFIRSLATRGSLGGLSAKAMEITDILKTFFDFVIIETVGVGQSEIEIASVADTTVVVFVPESGDEIQTLKSGIMEIADIFVVNKADRDGSEVFANNIKKMVHARTGSGWEIPVIKTVATTGEGIGDLLEKIQSHRKAEKKNRNSDLLVQKALRLITSYHMKSIDKERLGKELSAESGEPDFNLYRFIKKHYQ